jgi:hypothetical protein
MKKRIIFYIGLLLLTMSCSLEMVENSKSLKMCSQATGVLASAQSATPSNVAMSLAGSTSDIVSVAWLITKNGVEYYKSTTITSPFSLTSSTLATDGAFVITANVTTQCGNVYTLYGTYSYTAKTCTKASTIVASAEAAIPLSINVGITGTISDIASVVWIISQNNTEYYRSVSQSITPFSIRTPTLTTDGTFTVTAQIVDKCGLSYSLVTSYTYNIPSSLIVPIVLVEGATFQMGSAFGDSDEQPVHSVTLSSFRIGKNEVTQALWRTVMGVNSNYVTTCDNCPIEQVSWDDIQVFLTKLNTLTGKDYRLPTEAEWEYAARGGKLSKGYTYAGSNTIEDVAWYVSNSGGTNHLIGQKTANELGLYDMSGNVWEWCQDWYIAYSSASQNNPSGASTGTYRVLRGGSWSYNPQYSRVSYRNYYTPGYRNYGHGFRMALSL